MSGQEHTHGGAETQQEEEVIPPQIMVMAEILGRQHGGHKPHEAHHDAVEAAETIQRHREVEDGQRIHAAKAADCGDHHAEQRCARGDDRPQTQRLFTPLCEVHGGESCKDREENHKPYHYSITASLIMSRSHWGKRPISRHAAARMRIGTVIIGPASWALPASIAGTSLAGNHALMTTWNM